MPILFAALLPGSAIAIACDPDAMDDAMPGICQAGIEARSTRS